MSNKIEAAINKCATFLGRNKGTIAKILAAGTVVALESKFGLSDNVSNTGYRFDLKTKDDQDDRLMDYIFEGGSVDYDKIWAIYKGAKNCTWDSEKLVAARKIASIAKSTSDDSAKKAAVRALRLLSDSLTWGSDKSRIFDLILSIS